MQCAEQPAERLAGGSVHAVLNHANLFGGGYAHRAREMILGLLAELHG